VSNQYAWRRSALSGCFSSCTLVGMLLHVCRQFHTAEDALNGARHIVAMQVAHDPMVRACVRQIFRERAKITLKPTKKGLKVLLVYLSVCLFVSVCRSLQIWPRTESRYFQTSAEDVRFCEILMTKCIERLRDLFEYALYKFTLYLLTYLLTYSISMCVLWGWG